MRTHHRSDLTRTYALVALAVLGSLAMAFWGLLSETTAGPGHDDDMFAGIGYFIAAIWGIPAVLAALLLSAGQLFTERHDLRSRLAKVALAVTLAPWALLIAVR